MLEHVLPYAMVLDLNGNFVASPLLTEAPTLDNGGITQNPFTITYHLNPNANWADGSPITSADFDFTWRAIMNTTGAYTSVSYGTIEGIDASDPKTVVVRFTEIVPDWQDLFGGVAGGILERAAFPKFADDPKPNLKDEMQSSIPFSGGPWILKSFSLAQAVLLRNEKYYGKGDREALPAMASVGKAYTSIACGIMLKDKREQIPEGLETRVFTAKYLPEALPLTSSRAPPGSRPKGRTGPTSRPCGSTTPLRPSTTPWSGRR